VRKLIPFLLLILPFNDANAQNNSSQPQNLGISFNLLGPIFGEYNLGLSTFVSPYLQFGIDGTYYSTQYVSPEVKGWQTEARINYFFSSYRRSGFYLGGTGGFEVVDVKQDSNSNWKNYTDFTWSVVPGYAWTTGGSFTMLLGLSYGYSLGEIQILPEIGFVLLL
jgi:hypothetical protein